MNVRKILNRNELELYVLAAFEGDTDLLKSFHISPGTARHCARDTVSRINLASREMKIECYGFSKDGSKIGFVALCPGILYSFGLNTRYRSWENISQWWNWIEKETEGTFSAVLYEKNKRAIDFLKKMGMKMIRKSDNMIYLFKTKEPCL